MHIFSSTVISDRIGKVALVLPKRAFLSLAAALVLSPLVIAGPASWTAAHAQAAQIDQPEDAGDDAAPSDQTDAAAQDAAEVEPLKLGEAVVTRFPHAADDADANGKPIKVIDINGTSAGVIDIRQPGEPAYGQHWIDEPQRMFVTAGEVGQVFGVAIADDAADTPDIFLSATAAFGLHRLATSPGASDWMAGMWGPDAGPGTIYRLSAESGYMAEKFADVKLDGRDNTGASLGNIAYDKWHKRLFVSDMETGMIHSLDAKTGTDLGHYDHGTSGRMNFLDAWSGKPMSLTPIAFDLTTAVKADNCTGAFDRNPQCWNIADFRRRVWGLNVRRDPSGEVRLYYAVWGSEAFGNPSWQAAGDDRRNSIWSVALTEDGLFDTNSVRRELFMPAFWPGDAALGDKAGNSNPVSDITFPECGPQNVMLVAERGGFRNLGLERDAPFARPHESRVIRFSLGKDGIWRPEGRYDVGFYDRSARDGEPAIFANAAGGVDFGYKFGDDGSIDLSQPSQSVWMTGDSLCSPLGGCVDKDKGPGADQSEVHGLQGTPANLFVPLDAVPNVAADALFQSYMIDADINVDENGSSIAAELKRNDATQIGDVAIYQACKAPTLPAIEAPADLGDNIMIVPVAPPRDWPVHTLNMSHSKWSSSGHRVRLSWHSRGGSWHFNNRSWHWRGGSWHDTARSWHLKARSYHNKNRTWGDTHVKNRSFHLRGRTWDNGHVKDRSFHLRGRTWNDGRPDHVKGRSYHDRGRSWAGNDRPMHIKGRSFHDKGQSWQREKPPVHSKKESRAKQDIRPQHLRSQSRLKDVTPQHSKRQSRGVLGDQPRHLRNEDRDRVTVPHHSTRMSRGVQDVRPKFNRQEFRRRNEMLQERKRILPRDHFR